MKITLTFKTPDASDFAKSDLHDMIEDMSEEEQEYWKERLDDMLSKFVKYDEYIRVEFWLFSGEVVVLPVG